MINNKDDKYVTEIFKSAEKCLQEENTVGIIINHIKILELDRKNIIHLSKRQKKEINRILWKYDMKSGLEEFKEIWEEFKNGK